MSRRRLPDPIKFCRSCGEIMTRQTFKTGRLEDRSVFRKRVYCDRACMARGQEGVIKKHTPKNSRRQSAKTALSRCQACGSTKNLHVHHVDENPMNNSPLNLQTLCASCHKRWHRHHGKEILNPLVVCRICGKPQKGLGWCSKHYQRFRTYGDPYLTKRSTSSGFVLVRMPDGALSPP